MVNSENPHSMPEALPLSFLKEEKQKEALKRCPHLGARTEAPTVPPECVLSPCHRAASRGNKSSWPSFSWVGFVLPRELV